MNMLCFVLLTTFTGDEVLLGTMDQDVWNQGFVTDVDPSDAWAAAVRRRTLSGVILVFSLNDCVSAQEAYDKDVCINHADIFVIDIMG